MVKENRSRPLLPRFFKKRKVAVVGLVLTVTAVVVLVTCNGAGFRFLTPKILNWVGKKQGFAASLQIEGTLLGGFTIRDFELKRDGSNPAFPVEALHIRNLSAQYRGFGLIFGASRLDWLESFTAREIRAVLDFPDRSKPDPALPREKKTKSPSAFPVDERGYAAFWNLFGAQFDVSKVNVTLKQAGRETGNVEDAGFHLDESGRGEMTCGRLQFPGGQSWERLAVKLNTEERGISLQSDLPDLGLHLSRCRVAEPIPGRFTMDAAIRTGGAELTASLDENGNFYGALGNGQVLQLIQIPMLANFNPNLDGRITEFDIRLSDIFAAPQRWKIEGSLKATQLKYQTYDLERLTIGIQDGAATVNAIRPGLALTCTAEFPISGAEQSKTLLELPVALSGSLNLQSTEQLLRDFKIDHPLSGSVKAALDGGQFHIGKKRLIDGNLTVQSDDLAWAGQPIAGLHIAAKVEGRDRIDSRGKLVLDGRSQVTFDGDLKQSSLDYSAKFNGVVDADGWVRDFLATLEAPPPIEGRVSVEWQGKGNLRTARHHGDSLIYLNGFRYAGGDPIKGEIRANYEGKTARLPVIELICGDDVQVSSSALWADHWIHIDSLSLRRAEKERLSIQGSIPFDPAIKPFTSQTKSLGFGAVATDLAPGDVTRFFMAESPLNGLINGEIAAKGPLQKLDVRGNWMFSPELPSAGDQSMIHLALQFFGDVMTPKTWNAQLKSRVAGVQYEETALEDLTLNVETAAGAGNSTNTLAANLALDQSGAVLRADATFDLSNAERLDQLGKIPLRAAASLDVPALDALLRDFAPQVLEKAPLSGGLRAELSDLVLKEGSIASGRFVLDSKALAFKGEKFETLSISSQVDEPDLVKTTAKVTLDSHADLAAEGQFHLKERSYRGALALIADLAAKGKLARLLSGQPTAQLLPETTRLTWKGGGSIRQKQHRGDLDLSAKRVFLADGAEPIHFTVKGNYSGQSAHFPDFAVESSPLDLKGTLLWENSRLELQDLRGVSGGRQILKGKGSLPLDREKLKPGMWFAQNDPLSFELKIDSAPLEKLTRLWMAKAPLRSRLNLDLSASGSPANPVLNLKMGARDILVPQEKKEDLPVGKLDLKLAASDALASVTGAFDHPDINPLQISGKLPFHPGAWATGQRKFGRERVQIRAKMDKSSLAFLSTQIPGIELVRGVAALDASIAGSVSQPDFKGSGFIDLDRLKFEDRNAPDITGMDTVVRFADNQIRLEKLYAIVAGGILEGSGTATLVSGKDPVLDFSIRGSEVLMTRTPEVNVRSDADLRIAGPFSKVAITGEIGITNSRFFKNFDLLPIGLPALHRKSNIPTVERAPRGGGAAHTDLDLGIKTEPFANWTADLRIHTKDPFLIRGNLAQSSVSADLQITGPLSRPIPRGFIKLDEGNLSLPFSKVDVEVGRIKFDEQTGFNGALEFKALAKADKYRVNIYIHDKILTPKYVLTSSPPLPAEDIMTLLASGSVRSDLTGSDASKLAASKAASLFIKNLRKSSAAADKPPTVLDHLRDRTELDLGKTNPETGTRTFGGRIRLWKDLFFVGDVDMENDYRALLKYVFRFQ